MPEEAGQGTEVRRRTCRAGVQTIEGVQALAFVRQRYGLPNGDLDRIVRQQAFLSGLAHKVLSADDADQPGEDRRAGGRREEVRRAVAGLGPDSSSPQQMRGLTGGNIEFHTIPTQGNAVIGGADVLQASTRARCGRSSVRSPRTSAPGSRRRAPAPRRPPRRPARGRRPPVPRRWSPRHRTAARWRSARSPSTCATAPPSTGWPALVSGQLTTFGVPAGRDRRRAAAGHHDRRVRAGRGAGGRAGRRAAGRVTAR